ncbi:hypothetical protein J2Z31_001774 [Sinorhizobium kostiense]|uniref:Uncharacterized protein n=1 Tax=Sinorhizobium kostiense TaxID=76747 RepID=A0ABS4QXB1_9HYPH|nr:hypothetical protein [Sinorhizobium kostiense]MBP2235282.1 hypothetical protein [Sinorhizobium kostiense]
MAKIIRISPIVIGLVAVLHVAEASADQICGPGKHLASNAFACLPGDNVSRSVGSRNSGNQIAAGLAVGAAVLSIVQSLASQTQFTDNLGPVEQDQRMHGTNSRRFNRQAITLQQAGKFNEARIAFKRAADEAVRAGNLREAKINEKNADIADALHWLRNGYQAEKAGKTTKANIAYRMGIDAATRAGDTRTASQLKKANDALIKKSGSDRLIKSTKENCSLINGKYSCFSG